MKEKNLVEKIIADKVVELLEFAGKWDAPFKADEGCLKSGANYVTGKKYTGVNEYITSRILLQPLFIGDKKEKRSNYWITLNQAKELGASLKPEVVESFEKAKDLRKLIEDFKRDMNTAANKDDYNDAYQAWSRSRQELLKLNVSTQIVFNSPFEKTEMTEDENGKKVPVMIEDTSKPQLPDGSYPLKEKKITYWCTRYTTIYPIECFMDLPNISGRLDDKNDEVKFSENSITNIVNEYASGEKINICDGLEAKYDSEKDEITMPFSKFKSENRFYETILNALVKSTSASKRLNRIRNKKDEDYSYKEEEIGALSSLLILNELNYNDESSFNNLIAQIKEARENINNTEGNIDIYFCAINASKAAQYILKYNKSYVIKGLLDDEEVYYNEQLGWVDGIDIASKYNEDEVEKIILPADGNPQVIQLF